MVIPTIPPVSSITPPAAPSATAATASTSVGDTNFSSAVTNAIDQLQETQTAASTAEAQTAAGQGNLADTMIAASQASLATQVSTDLLDKAVNSYNDIMNMTF